MRKIISSIILFLIVYHSNGQNVGIGTNNPHSSAALDITDSSKGILIPRMTMSQRNTIQNPAEGLMVYQTDSTKGFWYFSMAQWKMLTNENPGNGSIKGLNHIGFASSATWICPEGINRIEIELWGAGGGCGSSFVMKYSNNATFCIGAGGKGGNGGYTKQIIDVIPGLSYNISIGRRGANGIISPNPTNYGLNGNWANILYPLNTPNTINGTDGGQSSFNSTIIASGGRGGTAARFVNNTCIDGVNGNNGTLINFSGIDYSTPIPSYVPSNYLRSNPISTAMGGESNNTVDRIGENGYCIISF